MFKLPNKPPSVGSIESKNPNQIREVHLCKHIQRKIEIIFLKKKNSIYIYSHKHKRLSNTRRIKEDTQNIEYMLNNYTSK